MSTEESAETPALEASAVPPGTAGVEVGAVSEAATKEGTPPPASERRKTRWSGIVIASIVLLVVVAALALPRRRAAEMRSTAASSIDRDSTSDTDSVAAIAPASRDIPESRATIPSRKKTLVKPAARPAAATAAPASPAPTPVVEPRTSELSELRVGETELPPAPPAAVAPSGSQTITGCLEGSPSDDRFRLTDTEGDNAPKARNWRTGFLKKRSASVNLVGVSDAVALEKQVGQKIAATGVLTNRDLKVSSVRVVSAHCD